MTDTDILQWGILRYVEGSGGLPDEDAAAVDGWYRNREDALEVG